MFAVLTAAIAPGMALLSYFYLRHQYSQDINGLVLRSFVIGAILVFPVMVLQYAFVVEGFFTDPISKSVILYGFFEEFFKWFLLFFIVYQHAKFKRHYDGIIFGVAISLGFASVENVFYLLAYGVETALGRALLPVTSHSLFGVIMGYYLGKSKMESENKGSYLLLALLVPVALHSLYDLILNLVSMYFLIAIIPFMILLWWFALHKVKLANQLDR
ncbi:protease [Alkalihalobacillus alcalophilus ATCC 27647 = CGMCC 1.3604]|uniref:Protease PrsW n=1 Tax=Alkalihalobacillus alcalophilus ATCC 27647 = CGMCC 1.3604 TaxID=1218173 RepID=A0A094Z027_ALKAL|nr:glutamic-type intramembrane protease PrsW [Alkalihalobacillus alcalophilus]KGA99172.1 protease [Alkalihalobacillus alcalophilus ATCC 27647 = CGMCC 1.3604]MED1562496.1 glutamic-type intramembrane protease PrsW [Alkalihalobacillus alcalophilus]THG90642.1 protease [Alkalihalobacillus alcalophilus ATCC 27647 = CGMCC 1.3604]